MVAAVLALGHTDVLFEDWFRCAKPAPKTRENPLFDGLTESFPST